MSDQPDFLPLQINLDGTWEIILAKLYGVFINDFIINKAKHCNIEITYNTEIKPDGDNKEEGFWHVISKDFRKTREREPDYKRARRLPWAKPLMESGVRPEIEVFDYDHGPKDKGIRRYIWLCKYRYALVLKKRKGKFYWITAYYVSRRGDEDLTNRYKNKVLKTATAP